VLRISDFHIAQPVIAKEITPALFIIIGNFKLMVRRFGRALPLPIHSGTARRRTQTRHPYDQPLPAYRCFFPDLTEFVGGTITRPDPQHSSTPGCHP